MLWYCFNFSSFVIIHIYYYAPPSSIPDPEPKAKANSKTKPKRLSYKSRRVSKKYLGYIHRYR